MQLPEQYNQEYDPLSLLEPGQEVPQEKPYKFRVEEIWESMAKELGPEALPENYWVVPGTKEYPIVIEDSIVEGEQVKKE